MEQIFSTSLRLKLALKSTTGSCGADSVLCTIRFVVDYMVLISVLTSGAL